jgi:predicted RNA binding protein YcfA (HicA-like mRNA interferase family)
MARMRQTARKRLSDLYSSGRVGDFPSLKAKQLLRILKRKPLDYEVVAQNGSHRKLESEGRPTINFAWHDRATVPPRAVKSLLVSKIGLTEEEAHDCL